MALLGSDRPARFRRWIGAVAALGLAIGVASVVIAPAAGAAQRTTFTCGSTDEKWVVPDGVTSVDVLVIGGPGGGSNVSAGSAGGLAETILSVTPETTYTVVVGCAGAPAGRTGFGGFGGSGGFGAGIGGSGGAGGSGGYYGAGGGGGSGLFDGNTTLLFAGGGGGAAQYAGSGPAATGGVGGGPQGGAGTAGQNATGGGGGTDQAAGLGGTRGIGGTDGQPGSQKNGGAGGSVANPGGNGDGGGGGGGGWYAGGGGGGNAAGGGGGSGYAAPGLGAGLGVGPTDANGRPVPGMVVFTYPPNRAPVAVNDSYSTAEDTTLTVDAAQGVLANDSDPNGDTMRAGVASGPAHGSVSVNVDGSFTYVPAANYHGPDSFTYRADDGLVSSNAATVSLNVTSVNDLPKAGDDAYSTDEDTTLAVSAPGVLGNDTDVDGDSLTAAVVSKPSHGGLIFSEDGSFTYQPAANYSGPDSFTYQVSDGHSGSSTATVSLTVNAVNHAPVAVADSYSTAEDTTLTLSAPGVLGNDTDVDGDPLTAVVASGPAHGSVTLNADGSFSYQPTANYNGPDSFTYQVSDGSATTGPVTVSLNVTAVNDAPTVAVAAGGSCGTDDRSGTVNLALSDVDNPAGALTLTATSSNPAFLPASQVTIGRTGGSRTLTAVTVSGKTGTAVVTVTVSDGSAASTVVVSVQASGNGNNVLTGTAGADILLGQNGNDTVTGLAGNDLLCGGSGDDILNGGAGDDTMAAGSGTDRLTGGPGADRFSGGSGIDTATDLTATEGDTQDGTIP